MFLDMKKISKISCEKLQDFFVIDKQIENLENQLKFEDNKTIIALHCSLLVFTIFLLIAIIIFMIIGVI